VELRQLEHFVAVADERSFTRASRRVHIVQSALSTSIRALEIELGAQLFDRSTRRVELTSAGRAFYEYASAALNNVRAAREAVAAVQGLERGSLVIGVVQSIGPFVDLAGLLGSFRADHPGIEMRVFQGSTTSLVDDVRQARIDVAIAPLSEPLDGVFTKLIACEPLVLACAPDHQLAGLKDVALSRLSTEPFIDFPSGWGTRYIVDRGFAQAGVERSTTVEVSDLQTILDLVARNVGVALLPRALISSRAANGGPQVLGVTTLAEPEICWELVAAFTGTEAAPDLPRNPAARAFLQMLPSQDAEPEGVDDGQA
jgi:DNA-binding transcriptional LysR family regulator